MSRPKRYRVTVRQTKKYTVELEAADESEAQTEAIAYASGQVKVAILTCQEAPRQKRNLSVTNGLPTTQSR